jgi:subtilase family serine protease
MKLRARAGLVSLVAAVALCGSAVAAPHHRVSPQIAIGPKAQVYPAGGPALTFTCQVTGKSPDATCYDPFQIRKAYGIDTLVAGGYDGTGRTIVIVDAFQSPTLAADVDTFGAIYGLPGASSFLSVVAPDGMVPFDPDDANMSGWSGEITLDVEWAHAIAPGAKVVLVLAKTNEDSDILSALKYAVDHNLGDVISMSFGENESCVDPAIVPAYHDVFADATRKGITLFASAGDQGAAQTTCDGLSWVKAVSHPASDPLVSGVGGTELHAARYCLGNGCDPATAPAPGTYAGEIVWNELLSSGTEATGGGVSLVFDAPPYQKSAVKVSGRAVPDVAYNAAIYHGVLVVWDGSVYLFGGTSAGSPQWAGITAIANQLAGKRLGYLNAAFYQIRQTPPNYGPSFHDITSGDNSALELDASDNVVAVSGFAAGTAWDATTGVGSPKASALVYRMIQMVSPGDAAAAIATSEPHGHGKPPKPGQVQPH